MLVFYEAAVWILPVNSIWLMLINHSLDGDYITALFPSRFSVS